MTINYRKVLLVALRMAINSDYRLVRRLKIFDPGYYRERCQQETATLDPLAHYLRSWENSPLLRQGWRQVPEPHPLFDTCFYLQRYFPGGLADNPFVHYLREGWRHGYWPGPFFDPETYRHATGWHEGLGNPLIHYSHVGAAMGVSPSPCFDIEWYLDKNPILAEVKVDIIKHYKLHGASIGKSPVPVFEPQYYLKQAGEEAREDPFSHFFTTQAANPNNLFELDYYCREYSVEAGLELVDYLERGVYAGHCTHPQVAELKAALRISILVPVYNPDIRFLNSCIRSVLYQAWPHWQLCLADDCSTDPAVRDVLQQWAERDCRIRITFLQENGGISTATNAAARLADGDYLAFLDNDDELTPDCLFRVAREIEESGAELLYSDEDLIGDDGSRFSVFLKPDYNPELLFSHNYITHFVAVKRALFEQVGGCDASRNGAQDYDLLLKLTELTDNIVHIDRVLYHWRASESSTSINHGQKSYAHEAGRKGLEASFARRGCAAEVEDAGINYFYRVRYTLPEYPELSVLLHGRTQERKDKLLKHTEELRETASGVSVLMISSPEELHQAIIDAETEHIVLLGPGMVRLEKGWLEELTGWAGQKGVGMVCGRILPDGEDGPSYGLPPIEDTGVLGWLNFLVYGSRHQHGMHCSQRLWCCDAAFTLLKKSHYIELGGLDNTFITEEFALLDFSFRLRQAGYLILYTPHARMISADNNRLNGETLSEEDHRIFQRKWQEDLAQGDPWYNMNSLKQAGIKKDTYLNWLLGA